MRKRRRMRPARPSARYSSRHVRGSLAAVLALAASGAGTGGGGPGARPETEIGAPEPGPRGSQRRLVLEREVYAYPARGRRNPFRPLEIASRRGALVRGATLLGVIHHPDPEYRIAVIGLRAGSVNHGGGEGTPAAGTVSRLRIGEELAGMRIVAIEVDRVVVEMRGPTGATTAVLAMPRSARGTGS